MTQFIMRIVLKFLGLILYREPHFMQHIQLVCGKLSRTAGIMTRIRNFVPGNVLLYLCYSLVYHYLSYGILIWGGAADIYIYILKNCY